MTKVHRGSKSTAVRTVHGVLMQGEWSDEGDRRELYIATEGDDELLVKTRMTLEHLAGAEVDVTGVVYGGRNQNTIVAKRLKVVRMPLTPSSFEHSDELYDDAMPYEWEPFQDDGDHIGDYSR